MSQSLLQLEQEWCKDFLVLDNVVNSEDLDQKMH
jgi:hypothetical protein